MKTIPPWAPARWLCVPALLSALLVLAPAGHAQEIVGPGGEIQIDQSAPEITIDPDSHVRTGTTAPTVGLVTIYTCDQSPISNRQVTFRGQSYTPTVQPGAANLPGCYATAIAATVNVPAAMVLGDNVLSVSACDTRGNCGTGTATYTWQTQPTDQPPTVSFNIATNAVLSDSTWSLRVSWEDDNGLNAASRTVTNNGAAVPGLAYTGSATSAASAGTIRLVQGWNTIAASIADGTGKTTSASVRIFSHRGHPVIGFAPDSVRTPDASANLTVSFTDEFGWPEGFRWAVHLNGIDVSEKFGFGSGWNFGPTTASSTANLALKPGFNTLVASVCNQYGRCSADTARHVYRYSAARVQPAIGLEPHLADRRIPSPLEATYAHATPAYVSRDVPRSVSLVYYAGQAQPRGYVEVDATDLSSQVPHAFSIRVLNAAGQTVAPETFYRGANGTTRLAASWDETATATSAPLYTVAVRTYWADGTFLESTTSTRVTIVNERNSAFGSGWSMEGLQRLHLQGDGSIVLTEGDGRASRFTSTGCTTTTFTRCDFTSPAGDFSALYHYPNSGYYTRQYPDASYAQFNSQGLLTETGDRLGNKTRYGGWQTVNGRVQLGTITDPAGKVTQLAYHTTADQHGGKLASITDPSGRITRFGYWDGWNNLTHIQDPDNRATALSYGTAAADTRSRLAGWTDRAGGAWSLAYDHAGLVRTLTRPAVPVEGSTTPVAHSFTTRTAPARLLASAATTLSTPAARTPSEEAWTVVKGLAGDSVVFALDRWRGVAATRDDRGRVSRTVRNANGQPWLTISAQGDTIRREWNGPGPAYVIMGRDTLVRYTYRTQYTCCAPYTLLDQVKEGDQVVQRYFYDARGLTDSVKADGKTTRFTHDAAGRTLTVTDHLQRLTTFAYDSTGFQNQRSGTSEGATATFGYDAAGRRVRTTDHLGAADSVQLDVMNRGVAAVNPLGFATRLHYGFAYLDSLTDARNQRYRFRTNALGWDSLSVDALGRGTRAWYNRVGQPDSIRDRMGRVVRYFYDGKQRLRERRAAGDTTFFSYDTAGTFYVVRNSASTDTVYAPRPAEGNITPVSIAEAATVRGGQLHRVSEETTPYSVEQQIQAGEFFTRGVVLRYGQGGGSPGPAIAHYLFNGDHLSRLWDGGGRRVDLLIDGRLRPWKIQYPRQNVVTYTYTGYDDLARIQYSSTHLENALGTLYQRDALGRVAQAVSARLDTAWVYRYDAAGQLLRAGTYDPADCPFSIAKGYACRATSMDTTGWTGYTYDAVGNRTGPGSDVQTGNRTVRFGEFTMEYDNAGFLTRKYRTASPATFDQTFTWNGLGQLVRVTTNGSATTFAYDGLGRRVRKSGPLGTTEYVYAGDQVAVELDGSGATRATYTYLPGVDQPFSMTRGGQTYYYMRDHLGSIVAVADTNGTIVNRYRYDPWGQTTIAQQGVENPFAFAAREYDRETGLYFNRARYYDPAVGRFISEDPIGLEGGISLYGYAANDPVNLTDPSGLSPAAPAAQAVATAAAQQMEEEPGLLTYSAIWSHCSNANVLARWNGSFTNCVSGVITMVGLNSEPGNQPWVAVPGTRQLPNGAWTLNCGAFCDVTPPPPPSLIEEAWSSVTNTCTGAILVFAGTGYLDLSGTGSMLKGGGKLLWGTAKQHLGRDLAEVAVRGTPLRRAQIEAARANGRQMMAEGLEQAVEGRIEFETELIGWTRTTLGAESIAVAEFYLPSSWQDFVPGFATWDAFQDAREVCGHWRENRN